MNLEIIETKEIFETKNIIIKTSGYDLSKRASDDGLVVFGTYDGSKPMPKDLIQLSCADFIVKIADHGFGPKHFAIFYDPIDNFFKIVDLF